MWNKVSGGEYRQEPDIPKIKIIATRSLVREYRLSPESRFAEKLAKKTMEMAR